MNREKYESVSQRVFLIGALVEDMELAEMLAAIDRAETFGPFVDPTLYRQYQAAGGRTINDTLVAIARQLLEVQRIVRERKPLIAQIVAILHGNSDK